MEKHYFDPAKRIYGILFAATTALFWGFLAIIIKLVVVDVSPITLVWFRFGIAFIILASYFAIWDRQQLKILIKPPILLIVAGLSLLFNYFGYASGIQYTSPGNAQIFIQLGPILLAIAGIVIFGERLSIRQFSGFILAGMGFGLFYRDQLPNLLGGQELYIKGVIWVVFAAVAWTGYAVIQKKLVQKYPAQQLNLVLYGLPLIVLTGFVPFNELTGLSDISWILLVFLGINTLIAYGCIGEAFKYVEANKVSVIVTLNPIITFIIMGILDFMNVDWIQPENITMYSVMGVLLVIMGALLVVLPKRIKTLKQSKPDL